jgi:hypothetical protein
VPEINPDKGRGNTGPGTELNVEVLSEAVTCTFLIKLVFV